MMLHFAPLTYMIFSPLLGVVLLLLVRKQHLAKYIALASSLVTFALSVALYLNFHATIPGFQFVEQLLLVAGFNIQYHVGIDGISLPLILLTTLLTPICILASWQSISQRITEYMIAFLLLECMVIGVFCALDLVLFYIFFEAMLIPMFLIIGIWGGKNRVYAGYKFFLYTLAGSVFLLLAIIYIYNHTGTMDIVILTDKVPSFPLAIQKWLWLAFFASFAVKIPMWPVHTWLPDAHVEAPTAGSVILAGILLKMGGYGFLRFSLPLLPDASSYFATTIFTLSSIAVVYASLIALVQQDMKKLIAYSSIAHMGLVTLGIFSFSPQGIVGAQLQMISHGLVSAALFLCVGVLYDRMHTREISSYGGVVETMPRFALFLMFFTMASIGLPGTSGFVGELLVLAGTYQTSKLFTAIAATGLVLGAAYMLLLYKKVIFGEVKNPEVQSLKDLCARETLIFVPLILLVLVIGIYPKVVTDIVNPATWTITKKLMDR